MKYNELTVLIPSHSLEDLPTELAEAPAASLLNAFAVIWHPSLLASTGAQPKWQRADLPLPVAPDRLVIVPLPCERQVPDGWIERTRREGSIVIAGESDRQSMLQQALAPLNLEYELDPDLVSDFLALGSLLLQTELLSRRMRNFSNLDEPHFHREALAAAQAAVNNDPGSAKKHLGYCFEMLLECRERFYPVDCFLIDLCLVNSDLIGEPLARLAQSPLPVNVMAPASDWRHAAEKHPKTIDALRQAVQRGSLEVIGGEDLELPATLMSLDDAIWHLEQGRRIDREIFGSPPVTWGRKRFGIGPHLPQILSRSGYTGALHLLFDDGNFPDDEQSQLRWEGVDGTCLNAFSRIPLAADSAASFLRFAERMAESMDYDHIAAAVFARWPKMRTPFLEDFRRAHAYVPVLGKFVTFAEFFSQVASPGRRSDFRSATYLSPELPLAVAKEEANPISRWVDYWQQERDFARADWCLMLARMLAGKFAASAETESLEDLVRSAHPEANAEAHAIAAAAIANSLSSAERELLPLLAPGGEAGTGVLIINPLAFPRRCLIRWPSGSVPAPHPDILERQIEGDEACAIVKLVPCGFVWLPGEEHPRENTTPGKLPMAEELLLRNDLFEVRLSDVTGGIGHVLTYRRSPSRISQQVAWRFSKPKQLVIGEGDEQERVETWYSSMQLRESRIISEGPVIGEIETIGDLVDPQSLDVLATYRQRTRVVRGRSTIEVDLELAPVQLPQGDPWTNYVGCRFAWKHTDVAMTASMQQGAQSATGQRIEAPQYLEIADESFRTTILTPGFPFHRKTGERMLDTLLLVEGETARQFQFAIAIDTNYPMQACLDQYSPPLVVATSTRPTEIRRGWFFNVTAANVQLTRLFPGSSENTLIVRLLETEGRARVFGLECYRAPRQARQIDLQGKTISDLHIDDAVTIEIAPYEICDVELTF
jgi:alpha-mannosidase